MNIKNSMVYTTLMCLFFAHETMAKNEGLVAHMSVHTIVVHSDGHESQGPANAVRPGDLMEYQVTHVNTGQTPVKNVEATLPIPAGVSVYVNQSAQPQHVLASTDGRKFEAVPLKRKIILSDGKQEIRPVPLNEYRYLRWSLGDVPAGQQKSVSARVRVADSTPVNNQRGAK